jgi:hypothetical protein
VNPRHASSGRWPVDVPHRTEPPRGRDTLRDGDVECVACGERVPESEAQADSWRAIVPLVGEPRWRCLRCQGIDPGE